ncbi:hypothetical protein AUC71_04280 [Methyloceanibacter marginalis]|uniref:Sulfotransferase n=1 Tax=Methyloceanibacter marginalis TaxID=1774971 RepID=A0A1E3VTB5_9HYPH|nr:sulfotransferase [Methyloceanibacter marginalis]ODR96790.1 hypothetical protein AUC71_04280 [Methyloceanibacter marginalis]
MSVKEYLQSPCLALFPFAFVVTYGRSGSTLLQGILNSIPGYCIRGENNSTLFYLFAAATKYETAHRGFGKKETSSTSPWFGADTLDPGNFSQELADLFLRLCLQPPEAARCIGFKEIRYTPAQMPDGMFVAYLDFVKRVFPGAAIIFNVREVRSTLDSGWWAESDQAASRDMLNKTIERFQSYAASRDNCFVFNYDSLIENSNYCKNLFDFLREPFDKHALERVLGQAHSYSAPHRASLKELIVKKDTELKALYAELDSAKKSFELMSRKLHQLEQSIALIRHSTSWRITAPLRQFSQSQQHWIKRLKERLALK